jgi:Protein of unknown function (DUF2510)
MTMEQPPPAGWYPDPAGQGHPRFWDGTQWAERVNSDVDSPSDPLTRAEGRRRAAAAHPARGWLHDLAVGYTSSLAVWIGAYQLVRLSSLGLLLRSQRVALLVALLGLIGVPAAMIVLLRWRRSTWLAGGPRRLGIVVTARVLAALLAILFGWLVLAFAFLAIGCSQLESGAC